MKQKQELLGVITGIFIFSLLFHRQDLGLNLLIFELIYLAYLVLTKQLDFKKINILIYSLAVLLTVFFTVLIHSVFSFIMNFVAVFILVGLIIYPEIKSILNSIALAFNNSIQSQVVFLRKLSGTQLKGKRLGTYLWKSRIFVIPLFIILIFILIYRNSNPVFDKIVTKIISTLNDFLLSVFKNFDALILVTLFIGLVICNFLIFKSKNQKVIDSDVGSTDALIRKTVRRFRSFKITGLRNELKAGIFLLFILNILILAINVIDIIWVWFGFEWEGEYLKQFVHEGTYLLILSILISIVLVLYFFRGNLNFYKNNRLLKILSFIWLAQNGILTISVAFRNFWYISYFSLAYKRIGVFIFLVMTLYGLYSVVIKVKDKKSSFYLFRKNSQFIFFLLVVCSLVNWDVVIANYNFNKADTSFLHLNFMATLSDKALPYLDKSLSEVQSIDSVQKDKFRFKEKFMTPFEYNSLIQNRKFQFKEKWVNKSWLEWNFAEYRAFMKLR
ncbi:MAG: DUF4173 domain-containing protein [Bacteroidales bacterium]|nr:DUF4173 domain-containing protein [Bacteroidales bacterium]